MIFSDIIDLYNRKIIYASEIEKSKYSVTAYKKNIKAILKLYKPNEKVTKKKIDLLPITNHSKETMLLYFENKIIPKHLQMLFIRI